MSASRLLWSVLITLALLMCSWARAERPSDVWVSEIQAPQYFAVLVEDIDASVAWYTSAFGLDKVDDSAAADGAWRIVNLRNESLAVEIIRDDRATVADRSRGFFKVGFRVPDVKPVAERVGRATGTTPRVLESPQHRIRILQLEDPDGNRIQLSSPLQSAEP